MKSVIVKELSELDVSNIQFEKPIKNKYGSYIANAYIKENNEKKDIYFQTDKVLSVDGIFCNENRSYIEIELNNQNSKLCEFINSLEEHCIMNTHKKSNSWFSQQFPLEVVDDFFRSTVKPARGNKSASIKFKIPVSKKKIVTQIYNQKRELINYQDILKNTNVKLVIKFEGIKFLKQTCLCEIFVLQIKYYDPKLQDNSSIGYIIQDSDNEEEDMLDIPRPLPNELDILMNNENNNSVPNEDVEHIKVEENNKEEKKATINLNNIDNTEINNNVEIVKEEINENNDFSEKIQDIDLNNIENIVELSNEEKREIQNEIDNSKLLEAEKNLKLKQKQFLTALREFEILKENTNKLNNYLNNDDIILSQDAEFALKQ